MKRIAAIVVAILLAILAVVPMTALASTDSTGTKMYVSTANGGTLRLRSLPSEAGKVLRSVGNGRPVTVYSNVDGWSEVRVQINGSYVYGYMKSEYLSAKDPSTARQTFKTVKTPFTVTVTPASANGTVSMWNTTSKKNENKVRDLSKGEKLTVIAQSKAWYQVTDQYGTTAYVAKAYVTK